MRDQEPPTIQEGIKPNLAHLVWKIRCFYFPPLFIYLVILVGRRVT